MTVNLRELNLLKEILQLTFESEMTGSQKLGLQTMCPQSLLVLVLKPSGGSEEESLGPVISISLT